MKRSISFRSREERTMDRKTFWFLSLFLISLITNPTDIGSLVASLTGFNVTPDNVPTPGLDSSEVKETVTELAVAFFGHVFSETETKGGQK
jgi:hypothetical protein